MIQIFRVYVHGAKYTVIQHRISRRSGDWHFVMQPSDSDTCQGARLLLVHRSDKKNTKSGC